MWCFIHKWNISRAIDAARPPAKLTRRHLERCAACREFSRINRDLEKRLAADAAALTAASDPSLAGRLISTVAAAGHTDSLSPAPSRPTLFRLRPAWAAAASLAAVVGVCFIWIVSSPPAKMPPLEPLFRLEGSQAYLESALQKAESPYQEEIQELRQTIETTADYLLSRLDVRLGPEN